MQSENSPLFWGANHRNPESSPSNLGSISNPCKEKGKPKRRVNFTRNCQIGSTKTPQSMTRQRRLWSHWSHHTIIVNYWKTNTPNTSKIANPKLWYWYQQIVKSANLPCSQNLQWLGVNCKGSRCSTVLGKRWPRTSRHPMGRSTTARLERRENWLRLSSGIANFRGASSQCIRPGSLSKTCSSNENRQYFN